MSIVKQVVGGRPIWFTTEQVRREDPDTGKNFPTGRYYVVFSTREPGPLIQGEVLKDDRGRAQLFASSDEAVAAGIKEVEARISIPTKVYAVGLPYGNTDKEFQTSIDLLRKDGIDISRPRVADSFGRKWLHVWDTREEAEQFATRLRQATGNRNWEVYELSPLALRAKAAPDRLEIYVGRQSDGSTYSLHPISYKLIRKRFPGVRPQPNLFMGRDSAQTAYQAINGANYDQIAVLLTGLSARQMKELGGYRVVDPASGLVLHETDLAPTSKQG